MFARRLLILLLAAVSATGGCGVKSPGSPSAREAEVYHFLFSNNPTKKTYFSSILLPEVYLEESCFGDSDSKATDLIRRYKVFNSSSRVDIILTKNAFFGSVDSMANTLPFGSSSWVIDDVTRKRIKSGNAGGLCLTAEKRERQLSIPTAEFKEKRLAPNVRFFFTIQKQEFDKLWTGKPPPNGFNSHSRSKTPSCFVSAIADVENNIRAADIHVYLPDFSRASFWSAPTQACLVRGAVASFGAPGILDEPDAKILVSNFDKILPKLSHVVENSTLGYSSNVFWNLSLMDAVRLYDTGGWTWNQVRIEIRRLNEKGPGERK